LIYHFFVIYFHIQIIQNIFQIINNLVIDININDDHRNGKKKDNRNEASFIKKEQNLFAEWVLALYIPWPKKDFFYELINWSDGDDLPWFTDQFLISKIKLIGQWSLP
jgi:hypothetical protein